MQEQSERVIIYANEAVASISGGDAAITFRWTLPKYDESNAVVGKSLEKEAVVSMNIDMLRRHAESILQLLNSLDVAQPTTATK